MLVVVYMDRVVGSGRLGGRRIVIMFVVCSWWAS